VLTWNLHDAYKLKLEMKVLSITWIIVFAIYIPYGSASFPLQRTLSPAFWILMGFYATFIISTIYPLYLVKSEAVISVGEGTGFEEFVDQLEFLPFRNAFRDYLALQFCQENILFYENACDWKRMKNGEDRTQIALGIRDNYILETGLCQINISGPARERICKALDKAHKDSDVPQDLFDEALNAVLSNMHANSYYQFKSHHLYFSAKA